MTRTDSEILLAVARLLRGEFTPAECRRAVRRAERLPNYRCQDPRNWHLPPLFCECGNELEHQFAPCDQCREEHAAIYHPNGKRRIFIHE